MSSLARYPVFGGAVARPSGIVQFSRIRAELMARVPGPASTVEPPPSTFTLRFDLRVRGLTVWILPWPVALIFHSPLERKVGGCLAVNVPWPSAFSSVSSFECI